MKLDDLLTRATDSLQARLVYTDPYEKDGITVIAAARLAGGGGGGNGNDQRGQGEGAGLGLTAKPAGAYVIKDGRVRWEPAVDVNRLVATMGAVALGIVLAAARIVRLRTRPAAASDKA